MLSYLSAFVSWWTVERGTLLVNSLLLTTAVFTACVGLKSYLLTNKAQRRAIRPMMTAEILPPEGDILSLKLQISNRGPSVAKNVRVLFDPPLPTANLRKLNENSIPQIKFHSSLIGRISQIFEDESFDTWMPGVKITASYWAVNRKEKLSGNSVVSAEGVPGRQAVIIKFEDENGEEYCDRFVLDIRTILGTEFRD